MPSLSTLSYVWPLSDRGFKKKHHRIASYPDLAAKREQFLFGQQAGQQSCRENQNQVAEENLYVCTGKRYTHFGLLIVLQWANAPRLNRAH